ncbi:MerR family transcriptional regulator [Brevundimonas sp.]|uniref:MerR family transcriptional regulator n=1 Tax=Brevundimonas sp. TaxID=1871086 RepID=UPI002D753E5E|nr:MerR family transcriptional regulator [Brevundimonas sp.]HYC97105.1 MerR family transcriptional regulator [Brevundimonas sp.]
MRNDAKHRAYAVGELARLSGVSIRTLHHYDDIGLLKPASVGENGYRLYGREELLRLQQILFHRELGMSLADIAAALDAPGFDRLAALRLQRERILAETDRHRRLLGTIDRTIAELEGERTMADIDLYKGLAPEKQAEYEAFIIDKYGDGARARIDAGKRRMAAMSPEEAQAHMDELAGIEDDLGAAVRAGVAPDEALLDPVLRRHHAWVGAAWDSLPSAEAYTGLGELYADHPDFVSRYETLQPGLAAWLKAAMAAFARRNLT